MRSTVALLGALALATGLSTATIAKEPWQLGHGPFTTAADVRPHNQLGQDLADILAPLAREKRDWPAALTLYAFGKNFPNHSVAGFADNYNGRLSTYLANAAKHFGSPSYQNHFLLSALAGTGRFARVPENIRHAAVDAGLIAVVINWCRYELGESERKAIKMNPPNWALTNGSPKNWNEIFAFYYGPEGRHSAFAALATIDGGNRISERLFEILAEGQEILVKEQWAADAASKVDAVLDAASIALFRSALEAAIDAKDETLPAAQARAAGFWLAAAETVAAKAPDRLAAIEKAVLGKPDRAALGDAHKALAGLVGL